MLILIFTRLNLGFCQGCWVCFFQNGNVATKICGVPIFSHTPDLLFTIVFRIPGIFNSSVGIPKYFTGFKTSVVHRSIHTNPRCTSASTVCFNGTICIYTVFIGYFSTPENTFCKNDTSHPFRIVTGRAV